MILNNIKLLKCCILCACITFLSSTLLAQTNFIPANNSKIQYTGRIDFSNPLLPEFSYPGTSIKAKFSGTSIKLVVKDLTPGALDSAHYYAILIDGNMVKTIKVINGDSVFTVATGLPNTNHTIEIFKRTESLDANNAFRGFYIEGNDLIVLPPKYNRKIEFIGDSWTAGYGNELSNDPPVSGFRAKNEDNYMAWGAIVARTLKAQYVAVAISGRGLYRNNFGTTNNTLPQEYAKISPFSNSRTWNTANYVPDVVVIKLGTNDFFPETWANASMLDSASFSGAYVNFVKQLRTYYPDTKIIIVCGSSLSDWWPANFKRMTRWRNYTNAIINKLKSDGDRKVYSFELSTQSAPYGEDWHPTKATHLNIANQITSFIQTTAGWQDAPVEGTINDPKIYYDGIISPNINKDSVVFSVHNPLAYADASSGIVYFPCNQTRNNQSGIRIRFKTNSPNIQLSFAKRSDGYFALTNPTNGFTVFADGLEKMSFSTLNFTITNSNPGTSVLYEVTLPNLYAVNLKSFKLDAGYSLEDPGINTKPKYAAFGTSITQGTGQYVNSAKTYPFKLAMAKDWNLYNFGVAGSIVGWQLAYNIKGTKFDYITVEQGFNDWSSAYSQPLSAVITTYARFLDSLRYFQPTASIYCIAPIVTSYTAAAPKYTLGEFRTAISSLVKTRNDKGDNKIFFIDGSSFTNHSMLADGVHLSEAGADTLAKALVNRITQLSLTTYLEELEQNSSFSIYPNPTDSNIFINSYLGEWKVYNSQGIPVKAGSGSFVELNELSAGIYILETLGKRTKIIKR